MHRESSISRGSILLSKQFILDWALVALALAGFAATLLTGCERTISDDSRRSTISIP